MPATDPLSKWLALDWERPERSYNPDVRDFLAGLLDYPKDRVVTEDVGGSGYPDIKLLTLEKLAWVVGDVKKEDTALTTASGRAVLWQEKRKYVEGLTQYVLFLTPRYLWVVYPNGVAIPGFTSPCHLSEISYEELREKLKLISYEQATHTQQWATLVGGQFPYAYLQLDTPELLERLRQDLHLSFTELCNAAEGVMASLIQEYQDFQHQEQELKRNLVAAARDTQRRAMVKLQLKSDFHRHLFEETLPRFEDQYGRDINAKANQIAERIRESFVADSVAVLIARVLFLRLVEDLHLTPRRWLSDGGPKDWAAFVVHLTGDAKALVELVSKDMAQLYQEPFQPNLFDWIYETNGVLDQVLQRLILRFNAYDFAGLSEEILGDIYQNFLPPAKRKRLGEFYTPPSIVDWLLEQTVFSHGEGKLLDPACGSGSFLVRYVHRCLEDAKLRGLNGDTVVQELQTHTWGFDLNPFASFISYFQLMWALVRVKPTNQPQSIPKIHIHNINSLIKDDDLVPLLGEDFFPPGSLERDRQQWKYILGNPPYIRAERVKYGEEMRGLWQNIWGQNSDTGLVFLYRSLTEWLEECGWLGMVVSGGYANSEAAAKVWKLLYPGREATLRKVVWLEFVDRLWDAAAIPLLLVIEKRPAQEQDEIELYIPTQWPSDEPPARIAYRDFFDTKVNPKVTEVQGNGSDYWGDYLLPLLHPQDIPILKKLNPNGNGSNFVELKEAVLQQVSRNNRPFWFTYGIQRGGVEVTATPTGTNPIQVLAGRNISMAWPGEPVGWVDLEAVKNRPNGKLSLWGEQHHSIFLVVSEIGRTPFASVVRGADFAALNTVIVALPKTDYPPVEVVATYLNSKLARFYWALKLRSGVLQGYYAHVYPRTLEALPWVRELDPTIEQQLVTDYDELTRLAAVAKNNPDEWLLAQVETRITRSRYKLSERKLGLNFLDWSPEDVPVEELTLDGSYIRCGSFYFQLLDVDLAELVYKLLTLNADEDALISRAIIQKLVVPQDYPDLMANYRRQMADFQQVAADFLAVLQRIDDTVYGMFGLTNDEKSHIENRLTSFPLNQLQPRYPWQTVRPRPIRAYLSDRFE